jgi:hypothetical protein
MDEVVKVAGHGPFVVAIMGLSGSTSAADGVGGETALDLTDYRQVVEALYPTIEFCQPVDQ